MSRIPKQVSEEQGAAISYIEKLVSGLRCSLGLGSDAWLSKDEIKQILGDSPFFESVVNSSVEELAQMYQDLAQSAQGGIDFYVQYSPNTRNQEEVMVNVLQCLGGSTRGERATAAIKKSLVHLVKSKIVENSFLPRILYTKKTELISRIEQHLKQTNEPEKDLIEICEKVIGSKADGSVKCAYAQAFQGMNDTEKIIFMIQLAGVSDSYKQADISDRLRASIYRKNDERFSSRRKEIFTQWGIPSEVASGTHADFMLHYGKKAILYFGDIRTRIDPLPTYLGGGQETFAIFPITINDIEVGVYTHKPGQNIVGYEFRFAVLPNRSDNGGFFNPRYQTR